jgi:hypothetical protein
MRHSAPDRRRLASLLRGNARTSAHKFWRRSPPARRCTIRHLSACPLGRHDPGFEGTASNRRRRGIDYILMDKSLHLTAWAIERIEGVAATARDVTVRGQVLFKLRTQHGTTFLPFLLCRDGFAGFVPEVFGPAVRLEKKQFDILRRSGAT